MVQVYGVHDTIAVLQKLEPELFKKARKDMRSAAEPVAASIRDYIPDSAPLRGFRHKGRTSWNTSSVKVRVNTSFSKKTIRNEKPLVRIVVNGSSPGMAGLFIADMAGKKNKIGTGMSSEYTKNGRKMRHKLNGQGRAMIEYLNGRWGPASRFIWRAAELHRGTAQASVLNTLDKISKDFNKRLLVKK
jgi:hypothetical protein